MPREKEKRGRRAEKKTKKEEDSKRKFDDAPEEPVAKRMRPSDPEADADAEITHDTATPFDPTADRISVGEGEGEENRQQEGGDVDENGNVFFGLLDEDEAEYFSRANEMLESNQFGDAEEKHLFIESVWREANGKELKVACSQGCSRLMEKLISMSDARQIRRLFSKFLGHFLHLVQHRFASHCCETLFINAAPAFMQKPSKAERKEQEEQDGDEEPELSLAEMFVAMIDELKPYWEFLLTERFASHTIRVLLLVLAGEPVDVSSTDSPVASRKKERLGLATSKPEDEEEEKKKAAPQKRSVPESFQTALKKIMSDMGSSLTDVYLRSLATHELGNPVLQVMLFLELSHFGKSSAQDPKSILRRLLPDESFEEGTETATFIRGLLYDPVGSHLVETMVRHMPGKVFKNLYKNNLRERIGSLSRNQTAGYVVLRILERLGKDDLKDAMDLIIPEVPGLIERFRLIVPRVLIERCVIRNVDTKPFAQALKNAFDSDPTARLEQMLRLNVNGEEAPQEEEDQEMEEADEEGQRERRERKKKTLSTPAAEKLHGSLFAQSMLSVPGPMSELIYTSLLAQSPETIIKLAKEATSSRVLQQALTSKTSKPQFRRQFTTRFQGHMVELAQDNSGSHVVDCLWEATKDIFFVKERMAQELAAEEMLLRDSFIGRAVWRNWSMDLYKRRRGEWTGRAKGIERQLAGMEISTGERPKSKIEMARERYAAKRNEEEAQQAAAAS
ncbi:Nucleolar protein 9 [Penicillium malachiteum]|uniref:Nucleolar protein 9 n=1 Tax=Penicillium malachiteum TaxID=1324776 RepID=UPI002547CDFD|nr:Nucleolar protein 9 [Penicillium malachiteum]KAJ5721770.1 Nucleolar protein 9 [Penicillium malachiteum]